MFSIIYLAGFSQEKIPVFTSGKEGHKIYRIPAIIKLPEGELFAFCEGRVNGGGDFGDINIVLKKSNDNGRTWGPLQTIVDYDNLQAGNPAPVVDITDPAYPKGRIFLFYNTGNNHEGEVRKGNGMREVWYITSSDAGNTWSNPVNITRQVHRPYQPQINPAYNFKEDWRSYANTPGHALQITNGNYKGRLYIAANHSSGNPRASFKDYNAHGFYTDDHGQTFQLGESVNISGSNEATAVWLSNNKMLLNARNHSGDVKARIVAMSSNGGQTWDTCFFDRNLPDPVCQGSLLNINSKKKKAIIAFCNAADTAKRNNLTLRISYDEGLNWKRSFLVEGSADNSKDVTAYSDMVQITKKQIGVLYERNNYAEIVYEVVKFRK